jgi:putative metal-binding protein/CARDB protein
MIKNKILYWTICILLITQIAYAITTYEETSTVSRIVGETPTELLRQLKRTEIDLDSATYFTHDQWNNKKDNILEEQFGSNVDSDLGLWDFTDVKNKINSFDQNELFILESKGDINPLKATAFNDQIYPYNLRDWQISLEQNNPLMLWDSPYAGSYLPKKDTFVSRLIRDSTVIAPSSFNSPEFTKSFICQLENGKTISDVFREARNFHYNGGSKSSNDNLIGLVLQSYALYGNPNQNINMNWNEKDMKKIKDYCKNYLENLAPGIEFLGYVGNYSKFKKHVVFQIEDFSIENINNFSIINTNDTYQNYEYGELVLPIAVRTTHFPTNTLITDFSIDYIGDFEDITLTNLPSFEFDLVNRTCYIDNQSHEIIFSNSYTKDSQDFIAKISPIQILNCTTGEFRIYKQFNYSIDYIAISPVLINKINYQANTKVNDIINMSIELMPITNNVVNGSLAIFDKYNNIIYKKTISTDILNYNIAFYAKDTEGLTKYSVEFIQNNQTMDYKEIEIYTSILDAYAVVPTTANSNEIINLTFNSFIDEGYVLDVNYYLLKDTEIVANESFSKAIAPGINTESINLDNLNKLDQSYTLTLELSYLGNYKTLSYLINTNNVPIMFANTNDIIENDSVIINFTAFDYDNDEIIVIINDSNFIKSGDSFIWKSDFGDKGNYIVKLTASDEYLTTKRELNIIINEFDYDKDNDGFNFTVDCDDNNQDINPNATESCDSIDNNCDGNIDEKLIRNTTCGQGACTNNIGFETCNLGQWTNNTCNPYEGTTNEICEGTIDENCNGIVDDNCNCVNEQTRDCNGSNIGECNAGHNLCVDGNWSEECIDEITPTVETCDNLDNNCDGNIDEELTKNTTCGTGVCQNNIGFETCNQGLWINNTCNPFEGASNEICEGTIDQDCDGNIDNGCECTNDDIAECGTDTGECQTGTKTCINGKWNNCSGNIDPVNETCDNLDNDCDGIIDNDIIRITTCGIGACINNIGFETCSIGQWINNTCNPYDGASDEICEGTNDENCDGTTDENCNCINERTSDCDGSNVGECNTGYNVCMNGDWDGECVGKITPTNETCDNLDNDCDGIVDNDLIKNTTCGIGACSNNQGIETCSQGLWIDDTCNPFEGASNEMCEGIIDENCDGTVDEGCNCINDQTKECGINTGECQTGLQTCIDGIWNNECVGEITPTVETCDDLDNDCDGTIDEELTQQTTCGIGACENTKGIETCNLGLWINDTCNPFKKAKAENNIEKCNDNIDNDCDSKSDIDDTDCVDLKIVNFRIMYPKVPRTNSYTIFAFDILNNGFVALDNIFWKIITGEGEKLPIEKLKLDPGKKALVYSRKIYSNPGNYNVNAIIDHTNSILEKNETNNEQTIPLTIS